MMKRWLISAFLHCREPMSLFFLSSFISSCPPSPLCPHSHLYYTQNKIYLFRESTLMNFRQNIQRWPEENLPIILFPSLVLSPFYVFVQCQLNKNNYDTLLIFHVFCILIQNIYKADILHLTLNTNIGQRR